MSRVSKDIPQRNYFRLTSHQIAFILHTRSEYNNFISYDFADASVSHHSIIALITQTTYSLHDIFQYRDAVNEIEIQVNLLF